MQVSASDPAGAFTLEVANGTLISASVDGVPVPRNRLEQRGDSLRVIERGTVLVSVAMTAAGGVEWQARESR